MAESRKRKQNDPLDRQSSPLARIPLSTLPHMNEFKKPKHSTRVVWDIPLEDAKSILSYLKVNFLPPRTEDGQAMVMASPSTSRFRFESLSSALKSPSIFSSQTSIKSEPDTEEAVNELETSLEEEPRDKKITKQKKEKLVE